MPLPTSSAVHEQEDRETLACLYSIMKPDTSQHIWLAVFFSTNLQMFAGSCKERKPVTVTTTLYYVVCHRAIPYMGISQFGCMASCNAKIDLVHQTVSPREGLGMRQFMIICSISD